MALRNITELGDEVLRKHCKEVTEITPKILELLDDMKDTLIDAGGVGLAAPQVGILRRIFIIDEGAGDDDHKIVEFINPKIVETKGHQEEIEGCLSIPGKYGVRIEDMMQITSSGAIDITKSPKNLIEI